MVCGVILGCSPGFSLQTLLVFLVIFFFRIQAGAAFVSAFFFKFVAWLADPLFHAVGTRVLEWPALRPIYTTLYALPVVPYTRFNNTIVMGGAVVGLVLSVPLFFVFKILIVKYRERVVTQFNSTWLARAVRASSFYRWYSRYEQLRG